MTVFQQSITGIIMILIGGLKTTLHIGSVPMLELPTCSGAIITANLGNAGWFEQAHCWGCYMLVAGLLLCAFALFNRNWPRRTTFVEMD